MMIEEIIIGFLTARLTDQVVMMRRENPPARYYVVEKTGSSVENHIYNSTITVQSYAPSLFEAAEMSDAVIRQMQELTALPEIFGVALNAEYNFTDTATKKPRYQAVFDISHADERSL